MQGQWRSFTSSLDSALADIRPWAADLRLLRSWLKSFTEVMCSMCQSPTLKRTKSGCLSCPGLQWGICCYRFSCWRSVSLLTLAQVQLVCLQWLNLSESKTMLRLAKGQSRLTEQKRLANEHHVGLYQAYALCTFQSRNQGLTALTSDSRRW